MPNVTTPIPPNLTGRTEEDIRRLKEWGTALIDELTYLFSNLDAGNVLEAASVKAENIDTGTAKIGNAQIGALTADKLVTGTVDTGKVTVSDGDSQLRISESEIVIRDRNHQRFVAAYDKETGKFRFLLCNEKGEPTVSINSGGNAIFSGQVESSAIYASTIIGTDSISYAEKEGGVFAQMDPTGLKVMQDGNGGRKQKIGMTVGSRDGAAYLVLGAGNGDESTNINGVVYTNGTFKIQKNNGHANMGLVGYAPFINFWEESGELWLDGSRVLVKGVDVVSQISNLQTVNNELWTKVEELEKKVNEG
ncbi:MAG: hypothetical protein J6A56_03565 [Clostridia bacterium]|nr:hypothetical protein [Clostridia bacterium]